MRMFFVVGPKGQEGPYDENYVRNQFMAGVYNANTLVWTEGMPQWAPLGTVMQANSGMPPMPNSGYPYQPPFNPYQTFVPVDTSAYSNPFSAVACSIKKIWDYSGRASRMEYWLAVLGWFIIWFHCCPVKILIFSCKAFMLNVI